MNLPRDLQLEITKRLDMDTRIGLGMVRRLIVPDRVKTLLSSIPAIKTETHVVPIENIECRCVVAYVEVGPYKISYAHFVGGSWGVSCRGTMVLYQNED